MNDPSASTRWSTTNHLRAAPPSVTAVPDRAATHSLADLARKAFAEAFARVIPPEAILDAPARRPTADTAATSAASINVNPDDLGLVLPPPCAVLLT